MEIISIEINSV